MAIIHSLKYTLPFSFVVPLLSLTLTHCHLLSLIVTRCITRCHSLSLVLALVVICCHLLSFVVPLFVTRCHSLSFVVTRCHSLYHSLPLIVIRCNSLSLDVPLDVTTRLSFYKRSPVLHNCYLTKLNGELLRAVLTRLESHQLQMGAMKWNYEL